MRRAYQFGAAFAALAGTGVIVFLALMSNPDVGHLHILPRDWARYLDHQHAVRHTVGFFAFYLLLAALAPATGLFASFHRRLAALAGLFFFAAALELAQLPLPHRSVNVRDVLSSWLGLALAFLFTEGFRLLLARFRKPAPVPHDP